ncbi:uncharacterized protein DUF418 [Frigoribacterium sp. PhB160]|uniref:DUF418 domain-containing protein n=1 Tax=Frigoribacterium sp. PhB160 TaxID=2485192 RepID=UPI000F4ACBE8|nr:DUF418 domain-containing protein [Frigoribacterium sp. PhB160]ROS59168.1 uncharacterized protein DUF418 [Frigoribacterium sp. PhB160]
MVPEDDVADAMSSSGTIVVRGFALAGVLFADVPSMVLLGIDADGQRCSEGMRASVLDRWVFPLLVDSRFVPTFCFVFGLSLQLIVDSARRRGVRPWWPLLLRLGSLLVVGVLHGLLWGGDVLRVYAVAALVLLPLGRMALTNHLGATVVVMAFAHLVPAVGWRQMVDSQAVVPLAVAVLAAQSLLSRLRLRRCSHGPVGWAWRSVTWRRRAPTRGGVL